MTAQRRDGSNHEAVVVARDEAKLDVEDRSAQDADRTAADLDQTQADSDQGASDADQQASSVDQTLADREQHASDRDQAAADWEHDHSLEDTAAAEAHDSSRAERETATRERESTAAIRARATAQRLDTAARRDEVARVRDLTAAARDRYASSRDAAADARDRAAELRERRALESNDLLEAIDALREIREAGATLRRQVAVERASAAADREAAAADRQRAAADRRYAGLDELTGVFRRGTGELALTHELARSRRSGESLVIAMIDLDGLKTVNDTDGHAAGDVLLRDVAVAVTSTLRSYDVAVRWGGDEFVCALSGVTIEVAADRITEIQRVLESRHPGASISTGLAEPGDDDTVESLIARADTALYRAKSGREA